MTATIAELREAIANAVATIPDLRATPLISDQVNPPQAEVSRSAAVYDEVQHGPDEDSARTWPFKVRVYAGRVNERGGQDLLDEYAEPIGDKSIKQAIENDTDLAALCDYVLVTEVSDTQVVTSATEAGVVFIFEDFTVQVAV